MAVGEVTVLSPWLRQHSIAKGKIYRGLNDIYFAGNPAPWRNIGLPEKIYHYLAGPR